MFQIIADSEEIYRQQQIAQALFDLELFRPRVTAFPQQVFRKKFDRHLFLHFNDWFHDAADYQQLQQFVKLLGDEFFYMAAPHFYLLNPVKFSVNCSHAEFISGSTYSDDEELRHLAENIGLRLSPENFFYSDSQTWVMVSDLTNNVMIVGLMENAIDPFQVAFAGKYFDIQVVLKNIEEFINQIKEPDTELTILDSADPNIQPIIETYF
jgi:hypothetical protein